MVYFFQGTETGNIKIGFTADNVVERLQQINSSDLLICLAVIKEAYTDTHYHQQFQHLWLHGEWFRDGDDLLAFIASLPKNEYTNLIQDAMALGINTGYKSNRPACYRLGDGALKCDSCGALLPDQQKRIRETWSPEKDVEVKQLLHNERMNRCHRCGTYIPLRAYFHVQNWKAPKINRRFHTRKAARIMEKILSVDERTVKQNLNQKAKQFLKDMTIKFRMRSPKLFQVTDGQLEYLEGIEQILEFALAKAAANTNTTSI